MTNKAKPVIISKTSYEGASYTHQGWVLDKNNQEYLLLDDEYDEVNGEGLAEDGRPVTYIWNIKDLSKPTQTGFYKGPVASVDHNQYIYDGKSFQSNYGSGFHIQDVSSIPQDPTGKSVKEIGFFDIYPEDDNAEAGGRTSFVGSWSSFAQFKSGFMYINTIERGGYVVKYSPRNDSVAPSGIRQGPRPAGGMSSTNSGREGSAKSSPWTWPRLGGSKDEDDE